jgi:hypothetical protein
MSEYQPSAYDLEWTGQTLRKAKHNTLLIWQKKKLKYRVDQVHKRLTLLDLFILSDPKSRKMHEATIVVCRMLGYTVVEEQAEMVSKEVSTSVLKLEGDDPRGKILRPSTT